VAAAGGGLWITAEFRNSKSETTMLDEYLGQQVVIDLKSLFVCLGTLHRFDDVFLEVRNADFHDLRDTDTTREKYVVSARHSGIKRNRKRVLLMRAEVAAVSRFQDVVMD
jgi:hypothetical protein